MSRAAARSRALRQQQRRRRRWVLWGGFAVCLAVTLVAVAGLCGESSSAAKLQPKAPSPVQQLLQRLRGVSAEDELARLLPASLTAEQCQPELAVIVAAPRHPLFRPAVLLARHFEMVELVDTMVAALPEADEADQALLVATVEQLRPWADEEFTDLLATGSEAVVAATLAAAGPRESVPAQQLIAHLLAESAEVRTAALAALPASLTAAVAEQIVAALAGVEPERTGEALLALARCPDSPVADEALYSRLAGSDESATAALAALAARGTPLATPEAVLAIAEAGGRSLRTRAGALLCLERTGTVAGAERLRTLWPRHPVLDYLAGRILIRAQNPAGLQLLLDVVNTNDDAVDEAEQALLVEARMGARCLLAHLSGTGMYEEPATWEAWILARPALGDLILPTPGLAQLL